MNNSDTTFCKELNKLDNKFVWHPYASKKDNYQAFVAEKSEGVYLELADGKKVIDGISSWWCMAHGHNVPYIKDAVKKQLDNLPHVMFAGLTHAPAVNLAKKIAELTPADLNNVFFLDSGSVAVEAAVKMAIQYQFAKNKNSKNKILTLNGGYHGDTVFAMALCDREQGMHKIFEGILPDVLFADKPTCGFYDEWNDSYFDNIEAKIEENSDLIAGIIVEPIFQGASAMNFYHPNYLKRLREICDKYDIVLIFDEIATGFGRTGELFASNYAGVSSDIICIGKALSAGVITLAAAVTNDKVAETISKSKPYAFMHGPTFMANPLACAAANASLEMFSKYDWQANVKRIEFELKDYLEEAKQFSNVVDVRVLGAIGVIEFKDVLNSNLISKMAVDYGVWLRPFDRYLYTMPPFITNSNEIKKIASAMCEIAKNLQ